MKYSDNECATLLRAVKDISWIFGKLIDALEERLVTAGDDITNVDYVEVMSCLRDEETSLRARHAITNFLRERDELRADLQVEQAVREHLEQEVEVLHDRVKELEGQIVDLLNSADQSWEDNNEGHDWADTVKAAREILPISAKRH